MRSVFEMTSDEALAAASRALEALGYDCAPTPNKKTSTGPWLAVYHGPDDVEAVRAVVFEADAAAIHLAAN